MSPSALFSLKDQYHSTVICALYTPFYLKGPHHSTGPMPPLPPSQSKVSPTQLSSVTLYPLLPQMSASLNCLLPPPPLLNQRSAQLNCHMPLSNPFSMQDQHHSIVICPPPPPSPSNVSTTQMSYVTTLPPSPSKVSITQLIYASL